MMRDRFSTAGSILPFSENRIRSKQREARIMAKAIADVFQPVDEEGDSYERMRAKGIEVIVPDEAWASAANRRAKGSSASGLVFS